jgi:uncharacterized protein (TIGR03437 family)
VSAASYSRAGLAPESIAAAFGANLATDIQFAAKQPLPTTLAGTRVLIKDITGVVRLAPLFFVSPGQLNYQIPIGVAAGSAIITYSGGDGSVSIGTERIEAVAPGLFAANSSGRGVAAAFAVRVKADGSQVSEPVARFDAAQNMIVAIPIDLGPATETVFLVLYGTGIRNRSAQSAVTVRIGGDDASVQYASVAPGFVGLDQVNMIIPRSLAGRGEVGIELIADGKRANEVKVAIK